MFDQLQQMLRERLGMGMRYDPQQFQLQENPVDPQYTNFHSSQLQGTEYPRPSLQLQQAENVQGGTYNPQMLRREVAPRYGHKAMPAKRPRQPLNASYLNKSYLNKSYLNK